jgi:non-ribosomal peptide synthetase component F
MKRTEEISRSERFPLTQSQAAMWLQWKLAEESPAYNNPLLFELRGEVHAGRLQRAFAALVDWHEVLRMRFSEVDGIPYQSLTQREGEVLDFHDLSGLEGARREERTQALLDGYLRAPFALLREKPYRFSLLKLEAHRFLLTVNVHHICADGISAYRLLEEISRDYGRADLEPQPVSAPRPGGFVEYLAYEAREWEGAAGEEARAFWQRQLGKTRLTIDFSGLQPAGTGEPAASARRRYWTMAAEDYAAVKRLVRQTRSTLFITLAAALKILLRRYSGQDELNLAYPVDVRPPGFQKVSGCLINYLPLNTRLSPQQTVEELIEAIKEVRRASKPYTAYPNLEIARIARASSHFRDRRVFNVALASANFALSGLKLEGLDVQVQPFFAGDAKEDLGLLFEGREELQFAFEHRRSVLSDELVDEMAQEFISVLRQMAAGPSRAIGGIEVAPARTFATRVQPPAASAAEPSTPERVGEQASLSPELLSKLKALYSSMLGLASVDPSRNIFELGGQSLIAAQLVARIQQEFSVALPLKEFMERSSLAEVAQLLSARGVQAAAKAPAAKPGAPSAQGASMPAATSNERAMFFLDTIAQCKEAYNIPIGLRISGGLDVGRLSAAVREVIERHPQLRACFEQTQEGVHKRISAQVPAEIIRKHPRTKSRDLRAQLTPLARRRFDLSKDLLLSVDHFPLEEGDDVVLYVFHHIIMDGISCGNFLSEVGRVYQRLGASPGSPAEPAPPAEELREPQADPVRLTRMIEEFGLSDRTLSLPYSAAFPDLRTLNGECFEVRLTEAPRAALEALSREQGLPVSVLLLAAYCLALHHASRDGVINIGLATMNRTPETFSRHGLFTNTVVLPVQVERGETVLAFLQRVAHSLFSVYQYADIPFQQVVSRTVENPSLGVTPLFQTFFNFMDRAMYNFSMGDVRVEEVPMRPAGSKFELSLEVHDLKNHTQLHFEYSTDVFERATVEALADLVRKITLALPRSLDRSVERLLLAAR